ncbi:hypothetical protein BJF80_00715 [Serinicoccus sp. CUA-874]|nr:hypothetical protein BJF80_00715 [Serinicoccus sp. CUA-874]
MAPASTRWAPNQITPTLDRFITSMTKGNISAMRSPSCSPMPVSSALVRAKRSRSCGSRVKARITRIPVICSRITRFTASS